MANIQISQLVPAGYELFNDTASFLNELASQEIEAVVGGGRSCHSHHYHHHHKHHSHKNYSRDYSFGW
jgi:hypothetical protein